MRCEWADHETGRVAPTGDRITTLRHGTVFPSLVFLDGSTDKSTCSSADGCAHGSPPHATGRRASYNSPGGSSVARPLPYGRVTRIEERGQERHGTGRKFSVHECFLKALNRTSPPSCGAISDLGPDKNLVRMRVQDQTAMSNLGAIHLSMRRIRTEDMIRRVGVGPVTNRITALGRRIFFRRFFFSDWRCHDYPAL
jgi:hypothetical protein